MSYVTEADFINKFSLSKNDFDAGKLQVYIDRYETITLVELFGKELFDLWVTGIGASDPIYETLRDPFTVQLDNGLILDSRGVNDVLLGVIYYHYRVDMATQITITGSVKPDSETSSNVNLLQANLQSRYNEAISTYCAIQGYICENDTVYPTFLGVQKPILSIF